MSSFERSQKSVLIVDDDVAISEVLGDMLTTEGYSVLFASNGEEGLKALDQKPDLVLIDSNMPVLSGPQMIRAMRADPAKSSIPFMLMTAGKGLDAIDPILRKPFEIEELLAHVTRIIGRP